MLKKACPEIVRDANLEWNTVHCVDLVESGLTALDRLFNL
jgi:hypothetical protein